MGMVTLWGLLAASLVCLTLLPDPTEACACMLEPAQTYFCRSPYVIKLQVDGFKGSKELNDLKSYVTYRINITKVFKGPESVKEIQFLTTPSANIGSCGYKHSTPFDSEEYVFTVKPKDAIVSTELCDFHKKWVDLSEEEQSGFEGAFKDTCG